VLFALISRTRLGRLSLNPVAEHYIMWQSDWRWWIDGLGGNLMLATTFAVNALMFIPIGQVTGEWMGRLPKLRGYALNLAGSMAGIALFVVLSALWLPPLVWLGIAALGLIPIIYGSRGTAPLPFLPGALSLTLILLAFGIVDRPGVQQLYSPYQTIACKLGPDSKYPAVARIMVNQASFQRVLDLSTESQEKHSALRRIAQYYDLPHQLKPYAQRVLVVGAGTGNDVAAALRASAQSVTAVEIDPSILFLGERLHPERPYADSRVNIVNDDARTFLRRSKDRFDLIVYGLLDSHTMLGSMANVRLDSFVYTVEAFREAAARLSRNGLLAVTFAVMTPQQGKKLYTMMEQTFDGQAPRCFEVGYDGGVMMVAGPAVGSLPETIAGAKEITQRFADSRLVAEPATDDWPFFYMPRRTYPLTYAVMILVLLLIAGSMTYRTIGLPGRPGELFGSFFFLGAGFMLIETKAITQLGLVLGNTWQVLAVVVGAILLLAFLANVWVMWRGPLPRRMTFALLGLSLLAGSAASAAISAGWPIPMPKLTLTAALTLPLFFSGLIFSSELAGSERLSRVLASNLFGAMFGGFLEYNSMYWGYSSLTWLGMAIYALAFLCRVWPSNWPNYTRLGSRFNANPDVACRSSRETRVPV
jgi:spermidine synthase